MQNKGWVTLDKQLGQTPLECLEQYRATRDELQTVKMAYAGRLDPMARGRLLVLLGETCKERDKYLALDKEYEFEVLLGVSSDTQDILGITQLDTKTEAKQSASVQEIQSICRQLQGKQELPYPAYSSKTVQGKPLFLWALENRLDEIEIPKRSVSVYRLDYRGQYQLTAQEVLEKVRERIAQVTPVTSQSKQLGQDFRRKEVLETWQKNMVDCAGDDAQFVALKFRCLCSSGTYMRTLAQEIAVRLGTTGLAWSIHRTKMGRYQQWGRFALWTKRY